MSTIVAGVDFSTLSVRVSLFDSERGRLSAATAEYPLHRKREDPDYATQSHADHISALVETTRSTLEPSSVAVYEKLYSLYQRLYFGFGKREAGAIEVGDVLPELRSLAHQARQVH